MAGIGAEAEPQDQHRHDGDFRHRIEADQHRIDGGVDGFVPADSDAEQEAENGREREADEGCAERIERVVDDGRAILDQRFPDFGGRRQDGQRDGEGAAGKFPQREDGERENRGRDDLDDTVVHQ